MAKEIGKKDKIIDYRNEFKRWLDAEHPYHTRFNDNYEKYAPINKTSGTNAKISDPIASELTERVVQKMFEREPKFFAESHGHNLPSEVKNVLASTAEFLWTNPDIIASTGSMRSKLKVFGREFIVTGNGVMEVYWNPTADAPDMRVIPIEDVVFDPTKNLKNSPVYYVRQFVSLDYLKDNVEIKKDGEVVTGMFSSAAIKKLERILGEENNQKKNDDTDNKINRSGGDFNKETDRFQLISRWDRKGHCVRFVWDDDMEDPIVVQEFDSILGTDPLQEAMDMEVVKEPYSRSVLDDLTGMFKANDMFLNQTLDFGSKALNAPTMVNPAIGPVNLKSVVNMYKLGGIVLADPNMIKQVDVNQAPVRTGMDMMNWIHGRSESVSSISPYLGGVPNAQSDKTQGTKGGTLALIDQAASPVQDRQTNIEESIIEPAVNKMIKMVGATMGKDEFKWVMVTGEKPEWIKVTKGLLTGKIKLTDLMQAKVLDTDKPGGMEELQDLVDLMIAEGKDPNKDLVFDVDWVIRVETGSLAEQDTQADVQNKQAVLNTAIQIASAGIQVPFDWERMFKDVAMAAGNKEPDQYIKKEEGGMNGGQQGVIGQQPGVEAPATAQPNGTVPTMAQPGMPTPAGAVGGGLGQPIGA